jgi:hypothetical protein
MIAMNKRILLGSLVTAVAIAGSSMVYASTNHAHLYNAPSSGNTQTSQSSASPRSSHVQHVPFNPPTQVQVTGLDKIQSMVPFQIVVPDVSAWGLVQQDSRLQKVSHAGRELDIVSTLFVLPNSNKKLLLTQAQDTGKPGDLLSQAQPIQIKGVDAWVLNPSLPTKQVMIWYKGKYYNLMSNLDISQMEQIAASLIQ